MRDLAAAELQDFIRGCRGVRTQFDPRAYFLAVFDARHADDCHIRDLRMLEQMLLDFAWIHVLAAANDHVLGTTDDVAVALIIDYREVAGVHPAFRVDRFCRSLWVFPIAEHYGVAESAQLA